MRGVRPSASRDQPPLWDDGDQYDPLPYVESQQWTFATTGLDPPEYLSPAASTDLAEHARLLAWLLTNPNVERYRGARYRWRLIGAHRYWPSRSLFTPPPPELPATATG